MRRTTKRAEGRRASPGPSERGHLLVILMIGVTVMLIMMTVAAQAWTFRMRREMELELIHRGEQYVKALADFRKMNGGAWPVGDLKVLEKKNPMGIRFIRKLYPNPMDPNGEWQYLYLHPGGSGFINPCASVATASALGAAAPGQIPVAGFNVGGGAQGSVFGRSLSGGRRSSSRRDEEPGSMDRLSAVDPEAFKQTGLSKMNLPIVGVVNCERVESIRTYMGQTWLNNWAFTPLAQGQFGGVAHSGAINAQPGGRVLGGGLGLSGSDFHKPGSKSWNNLRRSDPGSLDNLLDRSSRRQERDSWRRSQRRDQEEQRDEDDSGDDQYDDPYDDQGDDQYDDESDDDYDDDGGEDSSDPEPEEGEESDEGQEDEDPEGDGEEGSTDSRSR